MPNWPCPGCSGNGWEFVTEKMDVPDASAWRMRCKQMGLEYIRPSDNTHRQSCDFCDGTGMVDYDDLPAVKRAVLRRNAKRAKLKRAKCKRRPKPG